MKKIIRKINGRFFNNFFLFIGDNFIFLKVYYIEQQMAIILELQAFLPKYAKAFLSMGYFPTQKYSLYNS